MNKTLSISAMQYDFHTLLKVSDICGPVSYTHLTLPTIA